MSRKTKQSCLNTQDVIVTSFPSVAGTKVVSTISTLVSSAELSMSHVFSLANKKLKINWENKELENHPHPVYLGVTLDRKLSFKEHINKLKNKVATRNNLSKLATTKWGADAKTLKQAALALIYSTAEYCAPVWERLCHATKVDAELNKAC